MRKSLNDKDLSTNNKTTPKNFNLAGVDLCRTKTGNLVRINAVRGLLQYVPGPQPHRSDFTYPSI